MTTTVRAATLLLAAIPPKGSGDPCVTGLDNLRTRS
jgi:hypothetical protein